MPNIFLRTFRCASFLTMFSFTVKLICFWCFVVAAAHAQNDFYAPQTYRQNVGGPALFEPIHRAWGSAANKGGEYQKGLFTPAADGTSHSSYAQAWRPPPGPSEDWREPNAIGSSSNSKPEPWRLPYPVSKEQQASILHHKQALTSEGSFRFEYASDNGLAAGEQIEPDGSRVGAYQYKDPNGQTVKLRYRAGKEGFQILEGSHIPKSPEPQAPQNQDNYYQQAYAQQRQQYNLQQQYNQQKPEPQQPWRPNQGHDNVQRPAGGQYFVQNWRAQDLRNDDGQYRENEVEDKGPHSFGEGYAFAFQG